MVKSILKTYVDYYLTLNNPGFAVLITGDWGSGKTHQIENAIPKELQCHVSLFGIRDPNEIYASVFAKMYPGRNLAKKIISLTKDFTNEINGFTFGSGSLAVSMLSPLIKETVDKNKVIIFDDLERCPMNNEEKLGIINHYIEHHRCKVFILAHDEKIKDDFLTTKEKVIGHTIKISPEIEDAAKTFFLKNYKLNNFKSIKPHILNSFKKSGCQSLRILNHVINDCDRLLSCLEPTHIKNDYAMQSLFSSFCILNIEYRLGKITTDDICDLNDMHFSNSLILHKGKDGLKEITEKEKEMMNFFNRYSDYEICRMVLANKIVAEIFLTGNYPLREIVHSINTSRYFIKKQKNPPWVTIINFDDIDDEKIQLAIKDLFLKIKNFTLIDIGEMIHSFCLLFLLSEKKEIDFDFEKLLDIQINYIDELLDKGLLEPTPIEYDPFYDDIYERSYSHTYWITENYKSYIYKVIDHLKKKRIKSQEIALPALARKILYALETNINEFSELLLGSGNNSGLYSNIDILKVIPPEDFILHWFMLPIESLDRVTIILNIRYQNAKNNILKNEKIWLSELCTHLKLEAKMYKGLKRSRIERLIPYKAFKYF